MIYKDNKEVSNLYVNGHQISTVYQAGKIIWEAIKSCFSKGYWINTKGWINKETWRN